MPGIVIVSFSHWRLHPCGPQSPPRFSYYPQKSWLISSAYDQVSTFTSSPCCFHQFLFLLLFAALLLVLGLRFASCRGCSPACRSRQRLRPYFCFFSRQNAFIFVSVSPIFGRGQRLEEAFWTFWTGGPGVGARPIQFYSDSHRSAKFATGCPGGGSRISTGRGCWDRNHPYHITTPPFLVDLKLPMTWSSYCWFYLTKYFLNWTTNEYILKN